MAAPILIVGQGLAGTMLAWEFEKAGIDFTIVDAGHERATSRIGAGIINPVTGQRLVKTWGVDDYFPAALTTYREMEAQWGEHFLRPMKVRRFFSGADERRIFDAKRASGALAPFLVQEDGSGFWIEPAAQVDTAVLIATARRWLLERGRLIEGNARPRVGGAKHDLTILCTGVGRGDDGQFGFVRFQRAKGEILTVEAEGMQPDTILNCGHWMLPITKGHARVGATFVPGVDDVVPTAVALAELTRSARLLYERTGKILAQDVGLRMTTTDRRPVVGRSHCDPHIGIFNGLGSKGALYAPRLARQWVNHLTEGVPFDAAVDVARFLVT